MLRYTAIGYTEWSLRAWPTLSGRWKAVAHGAPRLGPVSISVPFEIGAEIVQFQLRLIDHTMSPWLAGCLRIQMIPADIRPDAMKSLTL